MRSGTKAVVNMQFGGAARGKECFLHSFMLKARHVALSAPSGCAPQAAQVLVGAIFTLRVNPPTSPRPTLSAHAEPIFREISPGSDIISKSHDANWRL